jgi:hypothetical protein
VPEPSAAPSEPARPVTGSAWGAVAPEGAHTALGVAARLGAYCWAEQQIFALLGGWIQEIPEPDAKLMVAEHADHAAWRAQRWYELLPTAPPGPDALVVGPDAVSEALGRLVEVADGPLPTVVKLAATYRVLLPRMAGALRAHLDWTTEVAEPAVGRVLRMALDDVATDWSAGERLLQAIATEAVPAERARSVPEWLDAQIAVAGGLLGPGSVGLRAAGGGP